ncbi:MAG TPA: HAMP domain-containing sensor histidine kinase [Pyrinomonadaceae bacterium]|nr:HAMP domain-containing sensor histidine kinase [Pyrinomonadaceae bacterium]
MRLRFTLFSKIMIWFTLNLLILAAFFWLAFTLEFRFDRNSPFFIPTNRLDSVSRAVMGEIQNKPRAERDAIIQSYTEKYKVEFFIFDDNAVQLGGREIALPEEVLKRIKNSPPNQPMRPPNGMPPNPMPPPAMGSAMFFVKSQNPPLYWSSAPIFVFEKEGEPPIRGRFIGVSSSIFGNGLFFNPIPWIIIIGTVLLISAIVWFPFVRRLTKSLAQMTNAAAHIADEKFDVRVDEKNSDELGSLGKSINHLATRLEGFVGGQKRFLGDISHELNSPLARMQFALSILEDRVDDKNRLYVEDVKEEVELMTKLVGELLEYSRNGIKAAEVELQEVEILPIAESVVRRVKQNAEINLEIDEKLNATAHPEMLTRAISNIVRNAVAYAGKAGEIKISAENGGGEVKITVADQGAGVPEDSLEKLFDPFYRVETHRARQTGGTGLGLAIVKTCIDACQGRVFAENLTPKGFAVTILLKK